MKTIQITILCGCVAVFLFSCANPSFRYYYETPRSLDFSRGKYLVNRISSNLDWRATDRLTDILMNGLTQLCGDSLLYIDDLQYTNFLTPDYFQPDPPPEDLQYIYEETGFDYLINVDAGIIKDEVGNLIFSDPWRLFENEAGVWIEVYDTKRGQRIYFQEVVGKLSVDEGDEDVIFADSAAGLTMNALRKGLKQMKKFAVKKRE